MKLLIAALVLTAVTAAAQQAPPPSAAAAEAPQLTHTEQLALSAVFVRYQQVQQDLRQISLDVEQAHPGYYLDTNTSSLAKKPVPATAPPKAAPAKAATPAPAPPAKK